MAQRLEELDNRVPGGLVESSAWNALVNAVAAGDIELGERLDALAADLQARIDAIVQGTCTVHADPGDDLAAAVAELPETGGELCLAAGRYELAGPLVIQRRRRLVITGAGPATVVSVRSGETALRLEDCREVEIARVRIEGGTGGAHLGGSLSVAGTTDVLVRDCTLACPEAAERAQACLVVGPSPAGRSDRVRVERCRLEIGTRQVGMLLIDTQHLVVAGNHLLVVGRPIIGRPLLVPPAGQGIVVAGRAVGTVLIRDNVVEDTVRGIHVGVSPSGPPADAVLLSGNVVHASVPSDYRRDRHAVFVGNARSIRILGTTATLRRTPIVPGTRVSEVEGIRVHGRFGPFLVVRDSSLVGFNVGVRVVPMSSPGEVTWLVADTMAEGAGQAVDAPSTVEQERNRPARGRRQPGPPAEVLLAPGVATAAAGSKHRLTAVVRDVTRLAVEGVIVRFSVSGANTVAETGATTNADGQATFEYTGTVAGTDTIRAYADVNRNGALDIGEPFANALQTYVAQQPATVEYLQSSVAATIGQDVTLTARVRDVAGNPVAGIDVVFGVAGANPAAPGAPVRTGTQGEVVFRYRGANAGTDIVTASVTSGGQTRSANATVTQLQPVPSRLVLAPGEVHAFRGEQAVFTATVFDAAGTALRDVSVRFVVTGTNFTGGELRTNASGQATFTYTGSNVGNDRVTAFVDLNANARQDVGEPFAVANAVFVERQVNRVLVPDVLGFSLAIARSFIESEGLSVGTVTTRPIPRTGIAEVVEQSPLGGTLVTPGSSVNLILQREFIDRQLPGRDPLDPRLPRERP